MRRENRNTCKDYQKGRMCREDIISYYVRQGCVVSLKD